MSLKDFENTSILFGGNLAALHALYESYLKDPRKVDPSLEELFQTLGDNLEDIVRESRHVQQVESGVDQKAISTDMTIDQIRNSLRALMLIRSYRVRGHLLASLDPLHLSETPFHPELDPSNYGFGPQDMDIPIFLDGVLGFESATLDSIMQRLKRAYAGSMGVEFMHIQDQAQKTWIQMRIENSDQASDISNEDRLQALKSLMQAQLFEHFLNKKHTGAKKFGLEGLEAFIPCLQEALKVSARNGVKETVLGMAHRGRLNVLANVMGKPVESIFAEFQGTAMPSHEVASGDVKYHQGYSSDQRYGDNSMHLSLTANPSHLEAVNPVVLGKVRAKQHMRGDLDRQEVMGILIHGDAAFIGQGIVAECFCLSELAGYKTGGTLHIVTNNQIGFTTNPTSSRSSAYCSDLAKAVQAPIFHVNSADMDAVLFVARLAAEFRHTFKKDVVIDLIGYRQNGHNESDDPSFTQPHMYKAIRAKDTPLDMYVKILIQKGLVTGDAFKDMLKTYEDELAKAFEAAQVQRKNTDDWLQGAWTGFEVPSIESRNPPSDVSLERLRDLGIQMVTNLPNDFNLHKRLNRFLDGRKQAFETGEGIDWATAEALAYASLLVDGHPIRHSGQDVQRGTFSQRHAVFVDQDNEALFAPLNHLEEGQALIEIVNSPLSEFSVLGFEYGYSTADPWTLTLWEAQFGDFVNGAQVIVDQFISSAEDKWLRLSGLVLLLPHGYEGQGPEHSSARPERFLQQCAKNNMQVANLTTPANYFHILRRQLMRPYRKPLVIFTPKSLLRHKAAVSSLAGMATGTAFMPVLDDAHAKVKKEKVTRLVFSTGKVYYDLEEARDQMGQYDTALIRIEELYPFPEESLLSILKAYRGAEEFIWCQEEPQNMGAWTYMDRRLETVLNKAGFEGARPVYVGRSEGASTATGYAFLHAQEQKDLVERALQPTTINMLKKRKK